MPLPTITITLQPIGTENFDPAVSISHMPGGWGTTHQALCIALTKVAAEMVKEARGESQRRIALATSLPSGIPIV